MLFKLTGFEDAATLDAAAAFIQTLAGHRRAQAQKEQVALASVAPGSLWQRKAEAAAAEAAADVAEATIHASANCVSLTPAHPGPQPGGAAQLAPAAPVAAAEPTAEPEKRKRRTKAEMEAARAAEAIATTGPKFNVWAKGVVTSEDTAADAAANLIAAVEGEASLSGLDELDVKNTEVFNAIRAADKTAAASIENAFQARRAKLADDAKKDAADEAADEPAGPEATHDDVRAAAKDYLHKYGPVAVEQDVGKVLAAVAGPGVIKISAIPADPQMLGRVVAAIQAAIKANPYGRTEIGR